MDGDRCFHLFLECQNIFPGATNCMVFDFQCEFQAQTISSIAKIRLVDFTQIDLQN